ncbi:hypothetical protein T484DRAFT_2979364 [Baffinella frigidus]|nr:hypothetical protein T484DRAFT_2979364 [Cryptophyta sp. CCMP2293]
MAEPPNPPGRTDSSMSDSIVAQRVHMEKVVIPPDPSLMGRRQRAEAGHKRAVAANERVKFVGMLKDELTRKLAKYDWSRTGNLNPEELAAFLRDNTSSREPTPEEVNWVLRKTKLSGGTFYQAEDESSTRDKAKAEQPAGPSSPDAISKDELYAALDIWNNYQKVQPMLDQVSLNRIGRRLAGYGGSWQWIGRRLAVDRVAVGSG